MKWAVSFVGVVVVAALAFVVFTQRSYLSTMEDNLDRAVLNLESAEDQLRASERDATNLEVRVSDIAAELAQSRDSVRELESYRVGEELLVCIMEQSDLINDLLQGLDVSRLLEGISDTCNKALEEYYER